MGEKEIVLIVGKYKSVKQNAKWDGVILLF